ncbi:AEC family transporter [Leifsonia aquatica]|uniref:AEC family transporter n=1 Tax=Leifsonia aquatica TaxID=144185 RepID=UPI00384DBD35
MNIAQGLLPVFFALAVGYGAGRLRIVDNQHVGGLNTIVMTIALPIALFSILAGAERADVVEHGAVAGVILLVMAIVYGGVYLLQRFSYKAGPAAAAVQALTVAFPNTAAVGLPIAGAVLGRTGELAVAVSLAVGGITLSPLTIAVLNRDQPARSAADGSQKGGRHRPSRSVAFTRALASPVVIAPILGISWCLAGIPFPSLLNATLSEIGGVTAGLALFVTGLVLSAQHLALTGEVVVSTLIADLVRPALALLAIRLIGLTGPMAAEVLVLMAVPSGFFGLLLALSHNLTVRAPGPTLFYSTVLSIATLAGVILALPYIA